MNTLIATFYGYKGGTGRTLALTNVARYLAEELGYRIGLIDLDLESPGLIHEPLCSSLDHEDARRPDLLKVLDGKSGFIDCYLERLTNREGAPKPILNYVHALSSGHAGDIVFMPAAKGSATKSETYDLAVSRFVAALSPAHREGADADIDQLPGKVNLASLVTWEILQDFGSQYDLDFLFVDGRTGTGPIFSPVYMYTVPHLMVLFCGLNEQNIRGCIATLQTKDAGATAHVPVIFVLSPVPTVGPANLEERLQFVASQLAEAREERRESTGYRYSLPSGVEHQLPYTDAAAFRESYFPGRYPNSLLAKGYRKLALAIAALVIQPATGARNTATFSLATTHETVHVALEGLHQDLFQEIDGLNIRPEAYVSEDKMSPWERLLKFDGSDREGFISSLPDVLILPQTHLQALTEPAREVLYDLNALRSAVNEDHRALNFDFLDTYYTNWRHWCSTDRALAGLPFSINARLLCCDTRSLREICRHYWIDKGQIPDDALFLPSSWDALAGLIDAGSRHGMKAENIFRFVTGARGLYYDWLNYIASRGGFDLIQSEGRLGQVVAIDRHESIDATRAFLRLAARCGGADKMEDLSTQFLLGHVAMYVGWTDSFRFAWEGSEIRGVAAANPTSAPPAKGRSARDILLGYVPRDMRFERNTLVDGWLMTFPKKSDHNHLSRALAFADTFLNPAEQRRLLRKGFPSPSAWAVDQELDQLPSQRLALGCVRSSGRSPDRRSEQAMRSFEVFLQTIRLAIHSGKWVASAKTAAPIEELVAAVLRGAWRNDHGLEQELHSLARILDRSITNPVSS